jgi:hypothetical protein
VIDAPFVIFIWLKRGKEVTMIKITKAKEIRKRDKKRNRYLLTIGNRSVHITLDEAEDLAEQLDNLIEEEVDKEIEEDWDN